MRGDPAARKIQTVKKQEQKLLLFYCLEERRPRGYVTPPLGGVKGSEAIAGSGGIPAGFRHRVVKTIPVADRADTVSGYETIPEDYLVVDRDRDVLGERAVAAAVSTASSVGRIISASITICHFNPPNLADSLPRY